MSGLQLAIIGILTPVILTGTGIGTKLYGDEYIWVAQDTYQQEKLYELQDEEEHFKDKEEIEGLNELDRRKLNRILKNIKRLESQIGS